jgi:hypothetical protein
MHVTAVCSELGMVICTPDIKRLSQNVLPEATMLEASSKFIRSFDN